MYANVIPINICRRLDEIRQHYERSEDYITILDVNGFGFTVYPIEDEDGNYSVAATAYHYTADVTEDDTWEIFFQNKGMLPGCFWTELKEL